ncbi:MAG: hypothetical protein IJ576_00160, partial [Synergistaceae bacterium]|nr:hypothetical protein [Synergistaceae bacterium]
DFNFNNLIYAAIVPLILLIFAPVPKILAHLNLAGIFMLALMTLSFKDFNSGFIAGVIMLLKLNFISIIFLDFIALMGIKKFYAALYYLKLNDKLRVLIILTLRGIFILINRFICALRAASLRANNINSFKLRLKIFACILGMSLIKSAARADKINTAMLLRSGGEKFNLQGFNQAEILTWRTCDSLLILAALIYALILNYA